MTATGYTKNSGIGKTEETIKKGQMGKEEVEMEEEGEIEEEEDEDEQDWIRDKKKMLKTPNVLSMNQLSISSKYSWLANNNNVRPLHIRAKVEGAQVRLTFNVSHTQPAIVKYIWTFDGDVRFLKGPEEYGLKHGALISSSVEFTYNASICQSNDDPYSIQREEIFLFKAKLFSITNDMSISIPTCFFKDKDSENETDFSQNLFYPNFWDNVNASAISTTSEKNATYVTQLEVSSYNTIYMSGTLYNPTTDQLNATNWITIYMKEEHIKFGAHSSSENVNITDVKFENVKRVNGTIPGLKPMDASENDLQQEEPYYVSATMSATLPSDKASGVLLIQNSLSFKKDAIASRAYLRKVVSFKPPTMEYALPQGKIKVIGEKR